VVRAVPARLSRKNIPVSGYFGGYHRGNASERKLYLLLLSFRIRENVMANARNKTPSTSTARDSGARRSGAPKKVAITLRLDPDRARRLQILAETENRTLTNYVETALIRDLSLREEAARAITILAAPGTSSIIAPDDVVRGAEESDAAFARRRDLAVDLWSIPDNG